MEIREGTQRIENGTRQAIIAVSYTHLDVYKRQVLIRAASFGVLKAAYPNYFADIGKFVNLVEDYLR